MDFRSKVLDPSLTVYLYGIVPPAEGTNEERLRRIAEKNAERLDGLGIDALNIYDIQDEEGRNGKQRPYPFIPTVDPRHFARILREATGIEPVVFKSVVSLPRESLIPWLEETGGEYNITNLVLVGSEKSGRGYPGHTVTEAAKIADGMGFFLGGIAIPERHRDKWNEHDRMARKMEAGIRYFNSQAVGIPGNTIFMLRDYDMRCRENKIEPARVILPFVPFPPTPLDACGA